MGQDTSRFEHRLATTRRPSVVAGVGDAAKLLYKTRVGAAPRTSFFAKSFSTVAHNSKYNAVLSARIELMQRRVEPLDGQRADYTAVVAHTRIKQHDTGRGRSQSLKAD